MSIFDPVTAHFRGGPLDGTMRMVEEAPRVMLIPTLCVAHNTAATDALTRSVIRYERGELVADEAVYEWVAE